MNKFMEHLTALCLYIDKKGSSRQPGDYLFYLTIDIEH